MKTNLIVFLLFLAFSFSKAQEVYKGEHFIEVTGAAQLEIEPNEIDVQVRLREFEENKQKVALEKTDKDFFTALKEAGIDRKRVELADAGSQLDKLGKKEKEAYREKTYQLRLTSSAELEKLVEKLQAVKIDLLDIVRLSHSDLQKIKMDLKVKALQAAKTKAETLLKAIGSEAGKPLMIRDWEVEPVQTMMNKANTMMMRDNEGGAAEEQIGFRKIKLQSQITAQFEIK